MQVLLNTLSHERTGPESQLQQADSIWRHFKGVNSSSTTQVNHTLFTCCLSLAQKHAEEDSQGGGQRPQGEGVW